MSNLNSSSGHFNLTEMVASGKYLELDKNCLIDQMALIVKGSDVTNSFVISDVNFEHDLKIYIRSYNPKLREITQINLGKALQGAEGFSVWVQGDPMFKESTNVGEKIISFSITDKGENLSADTEDSLKFKEMSLIEKLGLLSTIQSQVESARYKILKDSSH